MIRQKSSFTGYLFTVLLWFLLSAGYAQPTSNSVSLDYYLPDDVSYSESIPTPKSVIGHPVGAWHVRHAMMIDYMERLAKVSDRITMRRIGHSYEQRPLIVLTITASSNHDRLDQIQKRHLQRTNPQRSSEIKNANLPAVVYMGYSIHGDEASGTNTAMVAAYHLAAAKGEKVQNILDNTIILLDPSMNPDGYSRFEQWVNSNRDNQLVADPQSREQNQPWPTGRTNHYWFDLNRDWLLLQHPESRARIKLFHRWKPNVLTDFHEMGSEDTYFFQPGVPSRTHPLTPERNQQLTEAISEYHADILDSNDRLYYSKEDFDDFYYGKGSTYPDANGSIGILFEQASARSHQQETEHGVLTFPFAIKNHFLTTRSTLKAVYNLRDELLAYQKTFFENMQQTARNDAIRAYVFGTSSDPGRTYRMASLIARHDIRIYRLGETISKGGRQFKAGKSFIVPVQQPQYKMVKALFNRRTTFKDSLFYDVSAWSIPLAFNMPYQTLNTSQYNEDLKGSAFTPDGLPEGERIGGKTDYAYLFEWDGFYAPRTLHRFQEAGIRAKVATRSFEAITSQGTHQFGYGTVMVPLYMQDKPDEKIHKIARKAVRHDAVEVYAVPSGLTPQGIDLGSGSFEPLERPETMLVVGPGVNAYEAGQVWHLMDQRYKMPVSRVSTDRLTEVDWNRYNRIVMVDGEYDELGSDVVKRLKQWLKNGGTLITTKRATRWVSKQDLTPFTFKSEKDTIESVPPAKPYVLRDRIQGAQQIGGAIFYASLDTTHPLGYGYRSGKIPVFRDHTMYMKSTRGPFDTPLRYTGDPLASGYISEQNLEALKHTAAVNIAELGKGQIIGFADNPNFRAFWYGTNKLFANALFFGSIIDAKASSY